MDETKKQSPSLSYYHRNKDKINKRRRKKYSDDPLVREKAKVRMTRFKEKNPDYNFSVSLSYAEWKERYPEQYKKCVERNRVLRRKRYKTDLEYRLSEIERVKKYVAIRNEISKKTGWITNSVVKKLKEKFNNRCAFCGAKEGLTVDHIKPVIRGGTNNFDNLQILCLPCNQSKWSN